MVGSVEAKRKSGAINSSSMSHSSYLCSTIMRDDELAEIRFCALSLTYGNITECAVDDHSTRDRGVSGSQAARS